MKNKALRILVSIASVVSVIGSLILIVGSTGYLISGIESMKEYYRLMDYPAPSIITMHIVSLIYEAISLLVGLCVPVCGVIAFLHVNFLSINGTKAEAEEKRQNEKMQKEERERERKKQLLEKLKSELNEE